MARGEMRRPSIYEAPQPKPSRSPSNSKKPTVTDTGKVTIHLDMYCVATLDRLRESWDTSYSEVLRRILTTFFRPVRDAVKQEEPYFAIQEKYSLEKEAWMKNRQIKPPT